MGGRCYYVDDNGDRHDGPYCTDNFQIVNPKFPHAGYNWHSVEQAFQSLKFPLGSRPQVQIYESNPFTGESHRDFGIRVWQMGQTTDTKIIDNWGEIGKKLMLILNLQKYISKVSFQMDLLKTLPHDLFARESTADWEFFNRQIQILIRGYLSRGECLKEVLADVEKMSTEDVLDLLKSPI